MSDRGPHTSTDILVAHHAWVRALAARLVEGECHADDLVQEAWLVTHRSEPALVRRPKEWLAGILRNLARQSWRGEVRRRRREELAVSRPAETTIERAELGRELAGIVLALDEPFRTALLLRFYENLPPRVIAERTGVAVTTVDSRIARGLVKVRERWTSKHGSRAAWLRCLVLVAGVRPPSPRLGIGTSAAAASGSAKSLWLLAMNLKVYLAAGFVVGCGLLWFLPRSEQGRRSVVGGGDGAMAELLPAPIDGRAVPLEAAEQPVQEKPRRPAYGLHARVGVDLVVQVIDARSGRPLDGVPLVLRSYEGLSAPADVTTASPTGLDGIAVLNNARAFLRDQANPWYLVHGIPFEVQPALLLTRERLGEDVVVSKQPESGTIDAVLSGLVVEQGSIGRNTQLSLLPAEEAIPPRPQLPGRSWKAALQGGHTTFRYVELGRRWEVKIRNDHSSIASRAQGLGPVLPDEVARIAVVPNSSSLTLRAVDQDGAPLRKTLLQVTRYLPFGSERDIEVRTDANGVFQLEDPDAMTSVHVQHTTEAGIRLGGDAALWMRQASDMDDVVLLPDQTIASGTVVDAAGYPVRDAVVVAGTTPRFPNSGGGFSLLGAFARSYEVSAITASDGEFTLCGDLHAADIRVWAYDEARRSRPLAAAFGQGGLRIVLEPVWTVGGTILVDDGVSLDALAVVLEGEESMPAAIQGNGRFAIDAARNGRYALHCGVGASELATLENVIVAGNVDVGEIDLRGRLFRHEVLLRGVEPQLVRGQLSWRTCGSDDSWSRFTFDGVRAEVWAPAQCIDLQVSASGYQTKMVEGVSGRTEVTLRPALSVRIVLQTQADLPEPPHVLIPRLDLDGGLVGEPVGSPDFTSQKREAVFLLPRPGRVRLTWGLYRREGSFTFGGPLPGEQGTVLEILEQVGEQVIVVEIDGEALSNAMAEKR